MFLVFSIVHNATLGCEFIQLTFAYIDIYLPKLTYIFI